MNARRLGWLTFWAMTYLACFIVGAAFTALIVWLGPL